MVKQCSGKQEEVFA